VFILVLYNGLRPWNGALDIADLIEPVPGGLEAYRPHLRYALLDETQVPEMELESERNVAAALFRLEKSRDVETFRREVGRIAADPDLDPSLRASVYTWLKQVLLPGRFPEWSPAEAGSLEEVQTMLAERVKEWTQEWKEEGRQEGARAFQDFLLSEMVERFGPIPPAIRRRVKRMQDLGELKKLGKRVRVATSLDDLGL
jgi:hypothetical protein